MKPEQRSVLKGLSLSLRHLLEGYYDEKGIWHSGDLERRLNEMGIWKDRDCKPIEEMRPLSKEDLSAREIVDAYLQYREEAGVPKEDAVAEFVNESAYTWVNRLFALRCMEARGLIDPVILQEEVYGWRSLQHNRLATKHPELCSSEDEGLFIVIFGEFERRAEELPQLFNPKAPAVSLRPSAATLKKCIALLSGREPATGQEFSSDDIFTAPDAFGWAYQYWSAEEKDRVFEKVRTEKGAKIEGAEIIPATCIYTENYIVRFLVQNALGQIWLGMNPQTHLVEKWEYYVPDTAHGSFEKKRVREIAFLDPACGSGHFLIEAFDHFYDMYLEEGEITDPEEICASILERNLYGIDIDERAVQIATLALIMKAKEKVKDFVPHQANLVATNIRLSLTKDHLETFLRKHPEDVQLKLALDTIFEGLARADELGSLLQIEEPVEREFRRIREKLRGQLMLGSSNVEENWASWKLQVIRRLREHFQAEAEASDSTAAFFAKAGVKGLSLVDLLTRQYDVVATNPPYMGYRNMGLRLKNQLQGRYPQGGNDLYGCFIVRCGELGRVVAMVTMNSFMYISHFLELRSYILEKQRPLIVAELGTGAFAEIGGEVVNVVMTISDKSRQATFAMVCDATRAAYSEKDKLLHDVKRFNSVRYDLMKEIPGKPFVFRVVPKFLEWFDQKALLGSTADCIVACKTSSNIRFLRYWWEPAMIGQRWRLYEKESIGYRFHSSPLFVVDWSSAAQMFYRSHFSAQLPNEKYLFREIIVTSKITGPNATARVLHSDALADMAVNEVLPKNNNPKFLRVVCALLNSAVCVYCLRQLNPTVNCQPADLQRIPLAFLLKDPEIEQRLENFWFQGSQLVIDLLNRAPNRIEFSALGKQSFGSLREYVEFHLVQEQRVSRALIDLKTELDNYLEDALVLSSDERGRIHAELNAPLPQDDQVHTDTEYADMNEVADNLHDKRYFAAIWLEVTLLRLLGHRWPKDTQKSESIFNSDASEGIIPIKADYGGPSLMDRIQQHIKTEFKDVAKIIESQFAETVGKPIDEWLTTEFFKHHIKHFKRRPLIWQIESRPTNGAKHAIGRKGNSKSLSRPAFSCIVYYHKLNSDMLSKVRSQYVEPLRIRYETELRTMENIRTPSADQSERHLVLESMIEELKAFGARLEDVIANGFDSPLLKHEVSQEDLDKWTSIDGKDPPPSARDLFYIQEKSYNPDLDDGIRVNVAPLQKAGLLAADVLPNKDVDKAIRERAEWRRDERRWCREGRLQRPNWWKPEEGN